MNREHLTAFLWLRWRLRVNQFRRGGALNAVFLGFLAAATLMAAVGLFVAGFFVGLLALRDAPAIARLFTWDGVVGAFLFFWMIGLLTELQRAEGLALDKFLHLPVSVSGAFLVNYLSSLMSMTLVACVPGMVGLVLGLTLSTGPAMLLGLPLLAAGVLALTAITYQFQGWLASLMANPRRRRTVIVLVTAGFILVAQAPNLLNVFKPWEGTLERTQNAGNRQQERMTELSRQLSAKEVSPKEYADRLAEINRQYAEEMAAARQQELDRLERTTRLINLILPPGWLAVGMAGLADGDVVPALLATLGLTLIGSASLWRAYRTTVRLYTGHYTAKEARPDKPAAPPARFDPTRVRLVERRLPWVSERVSAVATAGLRGLTRAPEAKMALLAPLIMTVVFAGIGSSAGGSPDPAVRPLMVFGSGVGVLLLVGLQLIGNQFGYDRAGFRAYVLSPAPRRDILLGKNLAAAPLAVGMGWLVGLIVATIYPLRIDQYPALLAQLTAAYLVLCMLANGLSIVAPIPLAAGSLQPAQIKAGPVLLQLVFLLVLPVAMFPVMIPLGVEALLEQTDVIPRGVPVSLVLSLGVLGLAVVVYRWAVAREGAWLAVREKRVLEVVTSKAE